jgi:S1-C subfamily serine protease
MTAGDIITAFDGHSIDSTGSLVSTLDRCATDRWASISYVKVDGQRVSGRIRVTDEPADA